MQKLKSPIDKAYFNILKLRIFQKTKQFKEEKELLSQLIKEFTENEELNSDDTIVNYFKNDSFTLNKKSIEEISTTSESIIDIDLQAPKPRIRKDRERTNISEIENILRKCHIHLHTNKKGIEPFFIYDEILYGEYEIKIEHSKLMLYKEDLYLYEENNIRYKNIKKFFEYLEEIEKRIKAEFKNEYLLKINYTIIKT